MPNSKNTVKNKPRKRNSSTKNYPREHHESSDNVFKDMGKSDDEASNLLMRSQLMIAIEDIIRERGWTQTEAAKVIGVARPRIAELFASRIDLFGLDTLVKYLHKLSKQVIITIRDTKVA